MNDGSILAQLIAVNKVANSQDFGQLARSERHAQVRRNTGVRSGSSGRGWRASARAGESSPWCNSGCARPTLHLAWRRCPSLRHWPYSRRRALPAGRTAALG